MGPIVSMRGNSAFSVKHLVTTTIHAMMNAKTSCLVTGVGVSEKVTPWEAVIVSPTLWSMERR